MHNRLCAVVNNVPHIRPFYSDNVHLLFFIRLIKKINWSFKPALTLLNANESYALIPAKVLLIKSKLPIILPLMAALAAFLRCREDKKTCL